MEGGQEGSSKGLVGNLQPGKTPGAGAAKTTGGLWAGLLISS